MQHIDLQRGGAQLVEGPAGRMEVLLDVPAGTPAGVAVVAHPQPLLGGSAAHKIPQYLARGLQDAGWLAVRPNFRGVGRSEGVHDEGRGEAGDLLALAHGLRARCPGLPLVLVGFSFGAFVQARVARALADEGTPPWRLCLAGMPAGTVTSGRRYDPPGGLPDTLVVHGEQDDWVPLGGVLDWARPHHQPVVVIPGADHFFTGKLPLLRQLVLAHLRQGA
jgi:alpha/beta superfamily hydrolase